MTVTHHYSIVPGTEAERTWAAGLIASSEPWVTLGVTYEQCLKVCHDPEYLLFVAHASGKPCGVVILHPRGLASSPYLKTLVIESEYRSMGAGSALLAFAESYFSGTSRHFFLCVSSFNTRAMAFYERHGYRRVGEFVDHIIEGASEILMYKKLR